MPSIDDKPKRVVGSRLGRFGKEAVQPEACLEDVGDDVGTFDDGFVESAGDLLSRSVSFDSASTQVPSSFGSAWNGHRASLPDSWEAAVNDPGEENPLLAKDPLPSVSSMWGKEEDLALVSSWMASLDFPMLPPTFPPPDMPPFPWWGMSYPGPLMPGCEKAYFEELAKAHAQMAQHHAVVANTWPQQGCRRQQKGKGQAAPKQAPAKPLQEPCLPRDQDKEDDPSFTTVMLKNVPPSYSRELLIMTLNEIGFRKLYDFVYLPVEFKKKTLLGYAFVNLINHETAVRFRQALNGYEHWLKDEQGNRLEVDGEIIKAAEVRWGKLHNKQGHIDRYRNSDLMHPSVPDEYKPLLYGLDGEREVFPGPEPGKRTQAPRCVKADHGVRKELATAVVSS